MSVTPEQAKEMYRLGIKLRYDGKFGFKLNCPVCFNPVKSSCFCADTLDAAIQAVTNAKSPYTCSNDCYYAYHSWWDGTEDAIMDLLIENAEDDYEGIEYDGEEEAILKAIRSVTKRKTHIFRTLREENPSVYRKVQDWAAEVFGDEYEPYEGDGFSECDCEREPEGA